MNPNNLPKANEIIREIIEIQNFLNVFDLEKNVKRGSGFDIQGVIKIEKKTKISVLGKRYFGLGIGTNKVEITIPNSLLSAIVIGFNDKLQELEIELKGLWVKHC